MLSGGGSLLHLRQECGETHEMQIRDKMAPQGETQTGMDALGEHNGAKMCCTAEGGMEQEWALDKLKTRRASATIVSGPGSSRKQWVWSQTYTGETLGERLRGRCLKCREIQERERTAKRDLLLVRWFGHALKSAHTESSNTLYVLKPSACQMVQIPVNDGFSPCASSFQGLQECIPIHSS